MDKVRPGGVVAFVTSKGTMDKKSPEVRKYLAQRAELLGAVRLPNTAFKENAGTEVTSDILFLKKRDRVMDLEPDWVHLSEDENGIAMNSYFAEHPEMIVGKMEMVSGPYDTESARMQDTTRPFAQQLQEAVSHIDGEIEEVLPVIWDELAPEARAIIEKQGVVYTDEEGDLVTSIVNNKDCVFTCYDEKGCCYCAIEKAYREGKTDFYKPVSCHLYPIRIGDYGPYKAVNYHRWDVCKAAVLLGKKENLPVYRFLREPLIRKFGEEWYKELEIAVEELKKQHLL